MISQTILPFKLATTNDSITPNAGLAVFAELANAMSVDKLANAHLPKPGSGNGFSPAAYVMPILMTMMGGGGCIDDTRKVRDDHALRKLIGMSRVPSVSAIGDWLRRMGANNGVEAMDKVNAAIVKKIIASDHRSEYTLIVDPTFIFADKREAAMTYEGSKGYRPVVCILAELGIVIASEFRAGNNNGGRAQIIRKAFDIMPVGKKISLVLADSEYYASEVIGLIEERQALFAIAARMDKAVREVVGSMTDWREYRDRHGVSCGKDIAESVHAMNGGSGSFRLACLRSEREQGDLLEGRYFHHAIATNMADIPAEEVTYAYNGRSQVENVIRELKSGFGLDGVPSGDFSGNAMWFGLGVLAYNLYCALRVYCLPESYSRSAANSLRWMFLNVAGKVVRSGGRVVLKLAVAAGKLFEYQEARWRIYALGG